MVPEGLYLVPSTFAAQQAKRLNFVFQNDLENFKNLTATIKTMLTILFVGFQFRKSLSFFPGINLGDVWRYKQNSNGFEEINHDEGQRARKNC